MSIRKSIVLISVLAACAGVAADSYLESDGTQYLPIGYHMTANSRIELDFQMTVAEEAKAIIGGWNGTGARVGFWINGRGNFEGTYAGTFTGGFILGDTVRHSLIIDLPQDKMSLLTDGTAVNKQLSGEYGDPASQVLGLFAKTSNDAGTTGEYKSSMRVYSLKIYESGTLVNDYVPCLKGGREGLYDKVSGLFVSEPLNALAYGGDIMQIEDDAYVSSPNGNVSVDTGYYASSNTCIEADFDFIDDTTTQQFVFETDRGTNVIVGRIYITGGTNYGWTYADNGNYTSTAVVLSSRARRKAIIDAYNKKVAFVTCGTTNYTAAMSGSMTTCARTMKLFSAVTGDSNFAKMKLYGLKIYESGVLRHDYVPGQCEGVGVLKDKVTGKVIFSFKNEPLATGGKELKEEPYVESFGGPAVLLDYYPSSKTRMEVDYTVFGTGLKSKVIFGADIRGTGVNGFGFQLNGSGNQEARLNGTWTGGGAGIPRGARSTVILDIPGQMFTYKIGGYQKFNIAKTPAVTTTNTCKLALFGNSTSATAASATSGIDVRIYYVKIYEDGELVRSYEPFIRDGVVGFKDSVTGDFASGADLDTGLVPKLAYGGDIGYDGVCDAYVESDGTQFVNTGCFFGPDTRMEVDFALTTTNNMQAVAGQWSSAPTTGFWRNGSGNMEFNFQGWNSSGIKITALRHKAILDASGKVYYKTGDTTTWNKTTLAAVTSTAAYPLGIFGVTTAADGSTGQYPSRARIYSMRLYESDTLAHEFLPYKNGDTVGFFDTKTGEVKENVLSGANALVISGMGVDGAGSAFVIAPQNTAIAPDGTKTLACYAPGAVSYIWKKDGETLAGGTNATLTVSWQKQPRQNVYTVTPVYNVYGAMTEGVSASATVENTSRGTAIYIR